MGAVATFVQTGQRGLRPGGTLTVAELSHMLHLLPDAGVKVQPLPEPSRPGFNLTVSLSNALIQGGLPDSVSG